MPDKSKLREERFIWLPVGLTAHNTRWQELVVSAPVVSAFKKQRQTDTQMDRQITVGTVCFVLLIMPKTPAHRMTRFPPRVGLTTRVKSFRKFHHIQTHGKRCVSMVIPNSVKLTRKISR